ncbi:MAG: lysylphosphatidylglycerol synthase transmembrane domain-containing protein [bacterium]
MKKGYFLGILLSCLFLYLAIRNVEYKNVRNALVSANYIFIIPAMLVVIASFLLRAIRWGYILESTKKIGFNSLFGVMMIGFMVNNVLPARIGEFSRAYMMGRKENISKSLSFGTIVLERIFDGFALLFILGLSMLLSPFPKWVKAFGLISLFIFSLSMVFIVFLRIKREFMVKKIENLASIFHKGFSSRISYIFDRFIDGLASLENLKHTGLIIIYSIISQIVLGIEFHLLFFSFGFNLAFYSPYFIASIVGLSSMIPSAPGYIGVFQSFCVGGLILFGINKDIALSYSIVCHIVQYIPVTAIGIFYFINENIPISKIEGRPCFRKP